MGLYKHMLHRVLLIVSGVFVFLGSGVSQELVATGQSVAYVLDCGGRYLRIDTKTARILTTGSVGGVPSPAAHHDGCLVDGVQMDSEAGIVYAVVPKTATVDAQGERYYRVVALQLPTLQMVKSRDISKPLGEVPQLLLDREQHHLLVNYTLSNERSAGTSQKIVERLVPASLQNQADQASPEVKRLGALGGFGSTAHLDKSGRIVDRDRIIDLEKSALVRINGYDLLSEAVKQNFQSIQRTGATGKKYLDIVFADSADDRMLFVVGWDTQSNQSPAGGGLLIYDVNSQKVLSTAVTPYREAPFDATLGTPTVHLTPDGKLAIVEQYEWRSPEANGALGVTQERFKTGALGVYDTTDGKLVRTIGLDPAPGYFGRVVGFSSDQKLMYYASGESIYIVDLIEAQSRSIALPQGFMPTAVLNSLE